MKKCLFIFLMAFTLICTTSCETTFSHSESPIIRPSQEPSVTLSTSFTVNRTYGSHMVLQRDVPIRICGTSEPGKAVNLYMGLEQSGNPPRANHSKKGILKASGNSGENWNAVTVKSDDSGNWEAILPAKPASGPYSIVISGAGTETVVFNDVMVGEVWLCSGQSNMEMPIYSDSPFWRDQEYDQLLTSSNIPNIRIFNESPYKTVSPRALQNNPRSSWELANEYSLKSFSAVGYQFGLELMKHPGIFKEAVTIGLINVSWSGTMIEPWISRKGFSDANFSKVLEQLKFLDMTEDELNAVRAKDKEKNKALRDEWMGKFEAQAPAGTAEKAAAWKNPDYDDSAWTEIVNPIASFPKGKDGVAWYRKTVEIPAEWVGKELTLFLGPIDDCDWTFVNGQEVGQTQIDVSEYWCYSRKYTVPASLVTSQNVCIAIRLADLKLDGGFAESEKFRYLSLKDDSSTTIPLDKNWKIKVEFIADTYQMGPQPNTHTDATTNMTSNQFPATIYNSLIHPWTHYPIRGVIWYQGCGNSDAPEDYYSLQQILVNDWRRAWNNPDMPFIITQLSSYGTHKPEQRGPEDAWKHAAPGTSNFGPLRESQWYAMLKQRNTGMAVTLDIGDQYDIHPHNKHDVGRRLAMEAYRLCYGGIEDSRGPILKEVTFNGHIAELTFANCPGGLKVTGNSENEAKSFIIAGADGTFHHAKTIVLGNKILVWSPEVVLPTAVRYGWVSYTEDANLYNCNNAPATPFRTDLPAYITNPTFTITRKNSSMTP